MSKVIIYTDGACSGNPGPGGWGSILLFSDAQVKELGGFEPSTTNNRMEMTAVLEAVLHLSSSSTAKTDDVYICTDSTYVIRGITQWIFGWKKRGWKTAEGKDVTNQDLWQELDRAVNFAKKNHKLHWRYVPGHKGVVGNERCDRIAVAFSQRERPYLYTGPLKDYSYEIADLPAELPLPEMKGGAPKDKNAPPQFYLSYVDGILQKHAQWSQCQARVQGRSGARFKKVGSAEEARQVLSGWGLSGDRFDDL